MAEIKTGFKDDIAVINVGSTKLSGEKEEYQLWDEVENILAGGTKKIVLDVSNVEWSNSTGIGIMVSCWTMARKEQATMVVVVNSQRLKDIFKVTNLKLILKMYDTVEDALAGLR